MLDSEERSYQNERLVSDMNEAPAVACQANDGFTSWLQQSGGSLVITTYQAGLVGVIGWDGQQVNLLTRHFDKPMGLAVRDNEMALVTRDSVVLLADSPHQAAEYPPGQPAGYDSLYLPRASYYTCPLQIHDVAFGAGDELWIVNTRFSCLATLSRRHSFQPRWQPPFITELVPEDRCHLNGVAMDAGQPKFVSALGETNTAEGWRANKAGGGVLIDVATGETVVRDLCMPHSPRWHDGMLWFLDSGRGQLCVLQPGDTKPTVVCTLPGYARGLCFVGMHALIGLSLIRETNTFGGMPIGEDNAQLHCAVAVVDLTTGQMTGMMKCSSCQTRGSACCCDPTIRIPVTPFRPPVSAIG
jgi:uncharacterized protein (TIGR03032 family)